MVEVGTKYHFVWLDWKHHGIRLKFSHRHFGIPIALKVSTKVSRKSGREDGQELFLSIQIPKLRVRFSWNQSTIKRKEICHRMVFSYFVHMTSA